MCVCKVNNYIYCRVTIDLVEKLYFSIANHKIRDSIWYSCKALYMIIQDQEINGIVQNLIYLTWSLFEKMKNKYYLILPNLSM